MGKTVAVQGVAPRVTTAAGNPAPAMMERAALAGLAALRVPQASPALLQAATLLAAAAVSLHAAVFAWEVVTCPPAVVPW